MVKYSYYFLRLALVIVFGIHGLYAEKKEAIKNVQDKDIVGKPNVTVDLNPQGSKTVVPKKPKPAKHEADENIFLNFENASLESLLNYLAEEKKINVLPHKGLAEQKVTLSTRKPLTLERAWNVLLTILEMSGFTINQVGDLYRVVSNKENAKEPLPFYISKHVEPEDLPDTSQVIRYIYFFSNIRKDAVQGILSTMLEGEGSLQFSEDLQACILKEKSINIKTAMKIIKELDLGGLRESIKIITLREADAETLAKLLGEIIGTAEKDKSIRFTAAGKKKESAYFSSSTKIIPYGMKNALILLGTEKNLNRVVDFIHKHLDVPIGSAASRLHIKEIRYAKAGDIGQLVEKIIKPPAGQGGDKSSVIGRYKFFEDVIVHAEEPSTEGRGSGNRLIISCNLEDWARIESFIDSIDKPQPQIALELMIVSLGEMQSKALGVQLQSKKGKEIGMGINRAEFNNLSSRSPTIPDPVEQEANPTQDFIQLASTDALRSGSALMTLGRIEGLDGNNVWALIRSRFNITNSQIIGQPYLVANNYKDCKIELKETRRLPGPLVSKGGEPQKATFEDVDAGTTVDIFPQINSDGVVDLKLTVNLDQFVEALSPELQPTRTTRSIVTKSTMLAGEVLVLGGFKTSNQRITLHKTPILGDLPFIGNLFKNKSKDKEENYLYIFIRPSIIKPQFDGDADEYTQLKLDYAKYQMIRNDAYARDTDPIQRWYFKPRNYSVKQKVEEARLGIFAPIDDFAEGKEQPKSVNIKGDPFFKVSEAIEKRHKQLKQRKAHERVQTVAHEKTQQKKELDVSTQLL